jgi:hypothetical protein
MNAVPLSDYPFDPLQEQRTYVTLRSLGEGREPARRRLASLLDQDPLPPEEGGVAPILSRVEIDASDYPQGFPDILYVPAKPEENSATVCYVGHSVYVRETFRSGTDLAHHFRLLLINRESVALQIRADELRLNLAGSGSSEGAVKGSGYDLLAMANDRGEAIQALTVPPGERALAHAFFGVRKLTRQVHLRWQVEELRAPSEGPGALDLRERHQWPFQVRLVRRYLIDEGVITSLERTVGRGNELPEATDPGYYPEPRVAPVGGS